MLWILYTWGINNITRAVGRYDVVKLMESNFFSDVRVGEVPNDSPETCAVSHYSHRGGNIGRRLKENEDDRHMQASSMR